MDARRFKLAFGAVLRDHRTRQGYTQESFAAKTRLHRNYISGVERGEYNLTIESLLRIAEGLGVDLPDLVRNAWQSATR